MVQIVGGFRCEVNAYKPTLNRKCCEGRSGSAKGVPWPGHVSCHWILFHLLFCNWHGWLERSWILVLSVVMGEGNDVCKTTVLRNNVTTFFHPIFHLQQFLCHCQWYIVYMFSRTWFLITWAWLTFFVIPQSYAEFKIRQRYLEELLFLNQA